MSVFPRPALRLHPPAPEVGADGPLSGSHPLGVSAASESSGRRGVLLLLPLVFLLWGGAVGAVPVPPAPSPFADAALHTCSSHPPCKDTESCSMLGDACGCGGHDAVARWWWWWWSGGGLEVALGGWCNILKLGISFGEIAKVGNGDPMRFDPQGGSVFALDQSEIYDVVPNRFNGTIIPEVVPASLSTEFETFGTPLSVVS